MFCIHETTGVSKGSTSGEGPLDGVEALPRRDFCLRWNRNKVGMGAKARGGGRPAGREEERVTYSEIDRHARLFSSEHQ